MKVICKKCGCKMNFPQTEDIEFTWKCEKCMSKQVHKAVKPKRKKFEPKDFIEELDDSEE